MPKTRLYARIAITLPERDLAAADRLARSHDRSRSWIVAEAIRRYAAAEGSTPAAAPRAEGAERGAAEGDPGTAAAPVGREGLGASRLAQLTRDLQLTPEERVLAAEETLSQTGASRPRRHHVLAFARYGDFLDWKKGRDARE